MNDDLMLQRGFFDLRSTDGLAALDARQREDNGITELNGAYLTRDGHLVADSKRPSVLSRFLIALQDMFVPGSLKRA